MQQPQELVLLQETALRLEVRRSTKFQAVVACASTADCQGLQIWLQAAGMVCLGSAAMHGALPAENDIRSLPQSSRCIVQSSDPDLGARMNAALAWAFDSGARKVPI